MMSEKQAETPTRPPRIARPLQRLRSNLPLVVVPLVLFVIIGWLAPNFVVTDDVRQHPPGGDFLQEYVGGLLILDSRRNNQLYNIDAVRAIQHDAGRLQFAWDENHFFPMVYPPFYYAAVSPLSKLDYLVAARCWLFLMTGFLIAALWLIRRETRLPSGILLLACAAGPLLLSLATGQKSTLLLLILTVTYGLLRQQKAFAAGVVFGLIAFKPHLAIPIGLFMLVRRQWSFVLGCFFTGLVLIVASLASGLDVCADFLSVVMGFSDYVHNAGYHLEHGFSLWSAWQLAVGDATLARIATAISSLLVIAGTIWFLRQPGALRDEHLARGFSVMVIATVLLAPHLYGYDLTMLILPAFLLTRHALARQAAGQSSARREFAPVLALAIVLFGMQPLSTLAALTGIQFGVWLIATAWLLVLRSRWSNEPLAVDLPDATRRHQVCRS